MSLDLSGPPAYPQAPPTPALARRQATVEEPLWFGPADRPLAGHLHLPADRRVGGAAVLCPAIGHEFAQGHRALRELADRLAGLGVAALRLDYDGDGDSWGTERDADRVAAWGRSIGDAADWLRARGLTDIALAGLRGGATLAASVAEQVGASALVLWDPIPSGRAHVRRLQAFDHLTALEPEPDAGPGDIAVVGTVFTAATLASLKRLDLTAPAIPTLAVLRPDAALPVALDVTLGTGTSTDLLLLRRDGQPRLLDGDSVSARVPDRTVADIASWLVDRAPRPTSPLVTPDLTTVTADGVRERFVTLAGLAGVESTAADERRFYPSIPTEPERRVTPETPTVVLVSSGVDPHTGPGRAWTSWARTWAREGYRVLRMDLSGIGDSPAREGAPAQRAWGPNTVADIRALAAAADTGSGVAFVGLCSGARNALDAARSCPSIRALLMVNPPLGQPRALLEQITVEDPLPAALVQANSYRRVRHHVAIRTPGPIWRGLHRANVFRARTYAITQVVGTGTEVLLVYGVNDFGLFKLRQNAQWSLADLAAGEGFTLREVDGLDHAMRSPGGRARTFRVLTETLVGLEPQAGYEAGTRAAAIPWVPQPQ